MSLDAIQQNARSIADALRSYAEVEKGSDEVAIKKRKQLAAYILKLTHAIQKHIDQEKQNV